MDSRRSSSPSNSPVDLRSMDSMAEGEGRCAVCRLVLLEEDSSNCSGEQCLFKTYFSVNRKFEQMVNHYEYDLLKKTVERWHGIDSTGLTLWIRRKLVDLTMPNLKKKAKQIATPSLGPSFCTDSMAEGEGRCAVCRLVLLEEDATICSGEQCLFKTYFSVNSEFEQLVNHYEYDLLKKTVEHWHGIDSTGLSLWIRRKLVDLTMSDLKKKAKHKATPSLGPSFCTEPTATSLSCQPTSGFVTTATHTFSKNTISELPTTSVSQFGVSSGTIASTSEPSVVVSIPCANLSLFSAPACYSNSIATSSVSQQGFTLFTSLTSSTLAQAAFSDSCQFTGPSVNSNSIPTSTSISQVGISSTSTTHAEVAFSDSFQFPGPSVNSNPIPTSSISQVGISSTSTTHAEAMFADSFLSRTPIHNPHPPSSSLPPAPALSLTRASPARVVTSSVSQQGFTSVSSLTSSILAEVAFSDSCQFPGPSVNSNPIPTSSSISQVGISSTSTTHAEAMFADSFLSRTPIHSPHPPSSLLPPAPALSLSRASPARASPTPTPPAPARRARAPKARRAGGAPRYNTRSHGPVLPPQTRTGYYTRSQSQNRPPRAEQRNFVEVVARPYKRRRQPSIICNPICNCRRPECICFQARERAN